MVAKDSSSSLPFILVALLSFGALTPHLVSRQTPATSALETDARSASLAPAPLSRTVSNTAATDLLSEYFQVDTTQDGLRRRVAEATRALNNQEGRANAARVIRAFVCGGSNGGAESDLHRARQISAALVGSAHPDALLNCAQAVVSRPATRANVAWLTAYVQRRIDSLLGSAEFERGPLARAVIREQAQDVQVEFLIATVPDPVDSFQSWQFDPAVDGLRRGIEGNGYTFQRFQFPDIALEQKPQTSLVAQEELHRRWPGVVLFSRPTLTYGREDLLMLFLVPETPTAGIHHEAFHRSIEFIADWVAEGGGTSKAGLAAIIGPTFSGSTRSLTRALQAAKLSLRRLPCGTLRVISGNATNYGNKAIVDGSLTHSGLCLSPLFKATVHPNQAMSGALRTFQKGIGVTGRIATITENTVFGRDPARQSPLAKNDDRSGDLQITVPLNIAQLRNGGVAARRAGTLDPVLPSVPTSTPAGSRHCHGSVGCSNAGNHGRLYGARPAQPDRHYSTREHSCRPSDDDRRPRPIASYERIETARS